MPVVKGKIVLHQSRQDRDLVFRVVVKHLLGKLGLIDIVTITAELLMHETLLGWSQLATSNIGIARVESAVEFDIVASDGVIRVVKNRIEVLRSTANLALGGIGQVIRVAERTIVDGVLKALQSLATEQVIEGTVLHFQNNNILDIALQVLDRTLGMSSRTTLGHSRSCGRKGQ